MPASSNLTQVTTSFWHDMQRAIGKVERMRSESDIGLLLEHLVQRLEIAAKFFSARAEPSYLTADYARGDYLVFGSETKGLGTEFIAERTDCTFRIPIFETRVRSLNLANAVSIVVYEALRQTGVMH